MKKFLTALALTLTFAALVPVNDAFARHGADDPAGHVRHEHGAGHK
jgi:hypothetical protein